jgi:hypothetical protein
VPPQTCPKPDSSRSAASAAEATRDSCTCRNRAPAGFHRVGRPAR